MQQEYYFVLPSRLKVMNFFAGLHPLSPRRPLSIFCSKR